MNYLDLIILAFIAVAFILGFKDGFVRKLIGTLGFILAIFLGIKFSTAGGTMLQKVAGIEPEFATVLGGFAIFLVVILIASVLKRIVHPFDKVNNLVNRIVGGVVGVIQILVFLSGVFYVLGRFELPSEANRNASLLYAPVNKTIPTLTTLIQGVTPAVKNPIENIIMKDTLK